jgi:glycosyltransferase involved in cell wall biosynthesis
VRIVYFADIRLPLERANGIQTVETCHALATRGHEVRLIVRPDTHTPRRDPYVYYGLPRTARLSIEQAPVTGPQFARRLGYLSFALGRTLGKARADMLFTRDLGVAAMLAQVPEALRPPFIYESHGYAPDVAAELPELIATARPASRSKLARLEAREALVWRHARGYVTITQALADQLVERFGARDNIAVVPDGVRRPTGETWQPPPADPPPIVGYAGHLYAWKGVDVLLDALARVPSVRGLIIGGHEAEPDLGRVRDRVRALGLDARVELTGLVPPADVPALLARATILVLPNVASAISARFTSPLKLFEYMAAGRAIIASDLPAIREVITDDVNGLLVAPGDAAALAAAVTRLASTPALADRLARTAFEHARTFTWERRAERLEPVLERARNA